METILIIIVALFSIIAIVAAIVRLVVWSSNYEPCSHRFERVDDGTDKYAVYICTDCGKVKRIKLR